MQAEGQGGSGRAMQPPAIDRAADILWHARLQQRRLASLPAECRPANLDEGYQIQDRMAARAGRQVAGWKIAATSEAGQRHIGVTEPLAGRLFGGFILDDGAAIPAAPLHMKVAEAEFAFRLGRDLPPRARPYGQEEVVAAAAALHLAIEVPDARFDDFAAVGAPSILADDAYAGWFVLGPEVAAWRGLDLSRQPVRALRNGQPAGTGHGADALGDPRRALTWLANDRAARGIGLVEGDIVTTGTCVTPVAIASGDRLLVAFPGLGEVSVGFT
jgi:2-keto-4-pentenoate hydratase